MSCQFVKINHEHIEPTPIKDEPDKGRGQLLFPGTRFPNVALCARKGTGKSVIIEHIFKHYFTNLTPKEKEQLQIMVFSKNALKDQRWIAILERAKKEKLSIKVRENMAMTPKEQEAALKFNPPYEGADYLEFFVHILNHTKTDTDPEKRHIYHLFFDDQTRATRSPAMSELLAMNRHKFFMTVVAEQDWVYVNEDGRLQFDFAMIGHGMPPDRLKEVYEDMSVQMPFDVFEDIYHDVCDDKKKFCFLHINKETGNLRRNFDEAIYYPGQDPSSRETPSRSKNVTGTKRKAYS